jgi:hypothetical protein
MSGRRSRSKGARTERSIVNALKASGIAAVRVPLSGAVGGRFAGDILLPLLGRDLCVKVKARADGFCELYRWLHERDVLIVKGQPAGAARHPTAVALCGNCQASRVVMPRRPARITQADVARIIRAAKQAGASEVVVKIGEQSLIVRLGQSTGQEKLLEEDEEIVL